MRGARRWREGVRARGARLDGFMRMLGSASVGTKSDAAHRVNWGSSFGVRILKAWVRADSIERRVDLDVREAGGAVFVGAGKPVENLIPFGARGDRGQQLSHEVRIHIVVPTVSAAVRAHPTPADAFRTGHVLVRNRSESPGPPGLSEHLDECRRGRQALRFTGFRSPGRPCSRPAKGGQFVLGSLMAARIQGDNPATLTLVRRQ